MGEKPDKDRKQRPAPAVEASEGPSRVDQLVDEGVLRAAAVSVPVQADSLLGFADALENLREASPAAPSDPEHQLVTFHLDREEFGVPITKVREIVRVTEITRVPQAPPHIRGVTNLRGRILPVVELRSRLGLTPAIPTPRSRIVVAEAHGRVLGILVDAVSQVVKVLGSAITPPPEEIITHRTDYVIGVARLGARLILLLDLDRALLLETQSATGRTTGDD